MTKIVKKKHWNDFHLPSKPQLPKEPKEYFVTYKCIGSQEYDDEGLCLENIDIPEGYSYKDLEIKSEWYNDWHKDRLRVYLNEKKLNENYGAELYKYNQDLVQHEINLKNCLPKK